MKNQNPTPNPSFSITFLSLWVLNGLIILTASCFFPRQVVLGTHHISVFWSLIHVPSSLALIQTLVLPLFYLWEKKNKQRLSPQQWLGSYLLINFTTLWVLARWADQLGMGLASWKTALILAAVLSPAQVKLMSKLEKWQKSKKSFN